MPLRKALGAIGFFFAVLAASAAWFGVVSVPISRGPANFC